MAITTTDKVERLLKNGELPREAIKIDEQFYPRNAEDPVVVQQYAEAMRAGANFPPVKVDQSGRIIDGLHRLRAYDANGRKLIPVEIERVKDDTDFFKRALVANSHHGRRYTSIDYAHILLKGRELGIKDAEIAKLVYVTPGYLEEATRDWFAMNSQKEQVALKRTIRHMHGRQLTEEQLEANKRLSGMQPGFYANQIIMLCDNDLIDLDNEAVVKKFQELQESLAQFFLRLQKHNRTRKVTAGSNGR